MYWTVFVVVVSSLKGGLTNEYVTSFFLFSLVFPSIDSKMKVPIHSDQTRVKDYFIFYKLLNVFFTSC